MVTREELDKLIKSGEVSDRVDKEHVEKHLGIYVTEFLDEIQSDVEAVIVNDLEQAKEKHPDNDKLQKLFLVKIATARLFLVWHFISVFSDEKSLKTGLGTELLALIYSYKRLKKKLETKNMKGGEE